MHDTRTIRLILLPLAALFLLPIAAPAQGVPWKLLDGADELGAARKLSSSR